MVIPVGPAGVSPPKIQSLPLATALPGSVTGLGRLALAVQVFCTGL
jgi:hypothetical protein